MPDTSRPGSEDAPNLTVDESAAGVTTHPVWFPRAIPRATSVAALVAAGVFTGLVQAESAAASAAASADEFAPVTAVIQRFLSTAGDVVVIRGKRVHAAGNVVRINGETSVLALSLDPRTPSPASELRMIPATTPSLGAVGSALWLHDNHSSVGRPLEDVALEGAAIQAAIWVKEGSLAVSPSTIPNQDLRRRVKQFVKAAPNSVSDGQVASYPTGLQFTSSIRNVDAEWVTLQLVAIQSGESTFSDPQTIDLRIDGTWFVVKTGERNDVDLDKMNDEGDQGRVERSGEAPDNNTALVRVPRTDDVLPLDARWNLTYPMATVLLGGANEPALMTFNPIDVTLPQQLELDPGDYPNSRALLTREAESVWRGLGPTKWPVLIIAIWALPNIGLILNKLVAGAWNAGRRRWSKRRKERRKREKALEKERRRQAAAERSD